MSKLRDEYTARIKLQLDELNAHAAVMEARMQVAKAEVRASYLSELAKLRLQSDQAAVQLHAMQAEGEAAWDQTVVKMDKVRDAFVHAFKDFKAQF
ncbi:hypothetical protein [Rhodoferax lacus]|nr:hypothetical protein [Rhodoferax lacus]